MTRPDPIETLDQELRSLNDDVPPMPGDFHAGWMKRVEDETMQKPSKKLSMTRVLSVAAAAVFLIGGTLLSRDSLQTASDYDDSANYAVYDSADAGGYSMRTYNSAAGAAPESGMVMTAKSTASAPESIAKEKKIIRTASLTIVTPAFEEGLTSLRTLCEDMGGWVSYSSENMNGTRRSASLTMRIPADQLDAFLTGAGGAGRITWRTESADDVSDYYYDTQARLATQQALMARLQALITDAADLSDLLALESQIAETQYQIDSLQASLNSTDQQVNYATVEVTLREELPSDSITDADQTLGGRLLNALTSGLKAFVDFLADMVVFLAAALPFIAVIAVAVIVIRAIRRRKK